MPDDKAFGRRLQDIRKRRGLSQVDVARRLDIHQSLISQYERGYLRLHGALLVRLAQVLETTPDEILSIKQASDEGKGPAVDRRFRTPPPADRQAHASPEEAPPRDHRRLPLQGLLSPDAGLTYAVSVFRWGPSPARGTG